MRRVVLAAVMAALSLTAGGVQAARGGPQAPAPGPAQPPAPPPAAADPQQPAPPTFRTGIDFVRVDVIVTDKKGVPVVDLKPEEVEVFEDGERQQVESFKLFKVDEIAETTPARPIRSLFDEESEASLPGMKRGNLPTSEDDARQALEELLTDDARACDPVVTVGHGAPHTEALRVVKEYDAGLAVLGVHGRNVVDRTLFGSTKQRLVREATCPVLTVRT